MKCAHCHEVEAPYSWTLQACADGRKKRKKYLCEPCDIRLNKLVLNYIKDLSLEAAVAMIQDAEKAIEKLKDLKNKPKAVTKQIEELQEGINALVKELDNREETK